MNVNREEIKNMIDKIPEQDALELYNFLDYLKTKREIEQLNIDVNFLSEDQSLIDQIMKSRDDRANGRLYTHEAGLSYLKQKADLEDE
ncbi:hypothetical protein FITA111629_14690 [Filibacter tadaridae]|uniref:DUF2281 domain-containing protein n=1 Tax=Filibacter tadaridae TaxID=2483811 RepID=A0A3P5XXC2_9BACL|nr:hypothetical protein [Filibacter tadaridae]VDC33780.1 hypothetical protein FILTAD_03044 [Filibacter tadaridae]